MAYKNALVSDIDSYLSEFGFERIYTNIDPFKYYGDVYTFKNEQKLQEKYHKTTNEQNCNFEFIFKFEKNILSQKIYKNNFKNLDLINPLTFEKYFKFIEIYVFKKFILCILKATDVVSVQISLHFVLQKNAL